jgi:hypothetical protein
MATSSKSALLYLGACFAFLSSSCSLALKLDENQCDKDADCKSRGFEGAVCQSNVCVEGMGSSSSASTGTGGTMPLPGWECLGHFKYPDPTGSEQQMLFVNALDMTPVTGITMKLCGPLDATCASPLSSTAPDSMGVVTVPYPMISGYYLDITDDGWSRGGAGGGSPVGMCNGMAEPGPATAIRHSLAYLGDPIIIPPPEKTIRLVTNATLCTLAQSIMTTEEQTTHGTAVVLAVDCNGARASNVFVDTNDVDANTLVRYFKGGFPNSSATQTDPEGAVAVVNMPAGSAAAPRSNTWTARLNDGTAECMNDHAKCAIFGTGTAFMRPATLTYVHIGPSP